MTTDTAPLTIWVVSLVVFYFRALQAWLC